ncbi:hypothetical protein BH766_gp06 [Gordonia phage Demosthenes]|uniref:Uncharacterized protein n=4 Tax=Demosthenesvirus TaxID=1982106 RepID=A0A142KC83_9CAUD|nr:hypothetical protein BH766_gp06 [Gordonia phage Demosthenes]YP_009603280.1 hypothetical protein FDH67_gp06 [Gordonia phage Katyusha]AMS03716.1 hypothetical protein SEA_BENCZKOWSKI14_6 [Gordonia phage Benczkowski14]QFG08495.1 hypothetical protein PBI_ASERPROCKY_6 [Gordonia phage ASerpRocky]AMS03399.1 hypothetical protein SEA_KATYUSHA_6 [Gordonia phage Katyusha]ANA85976.1 hypothetical protein PBI_DEMOSTHENES_6 [Gordonia phage Demosthenes]
MESNEHEVEFEQDIKRSVIMAFQSTDVADVTNVAERMNAFAVGLNFDGYQVVVMHTDDTNLDKHECERCGYVNKRDS